MIADTFVSAFLAQDDDAMVDDEIMEDEDADDEDEDEDEDDADGGAGINEEE